MRPRRTASRLIAATALARPFAVGPVEYFPKEL